MNLGVGYCPRCQKLFAKNAFGMCGNCLREIEQEYDRCIQYLRENKRSTIEELSEATDVSIKQITKFIREGRISISQNPHMGYPCDGCGTTIRTGNMCPSCRSRLTSEVKHMQQVRERQTAQEDRKSTFLINQDDHKN